MVYLYTLPTCPICNMVKKKLQDKQIIYKEKPFEEGHFDTDRAPVMQVINDTGEIMTFTLPLEMNQWINSQE